MRGTPVVDFDLVVRSSDIVTPCLEKTTYDSTFVFDGDYDAHEFLEPFQVQQAGDNAELASP